MNTDREITHISSFYRLFFFYVEPFSALVGAIYAVQPSIYISLLTLDKFSPAVQSTSTQVDIALYQLANLYLLFTLNEHFVLKSTRNLSTWRALLFGLLVADFGHLATNIPLGLDAFWKFWQWNAMMWGGIGFVYAGATTRILFLSGYGVTSAIKKRGE